MTFKTLRTLFLVACASASCAAFSQTVPPSEMASEAAIENLLDVMDAKANFARMQSQIRQSMKGSFDVIYKDKHFSASQQAIVDEGISKMADAIHEQFDWNTLKPMFIKVYRQNLTAEEVSQLTAFYQTPGGQALIRKLPMIMQTALSETQAQMKFLIPRFEAIQNEIEEKLKADAQKH